MDDHCFILCYVQDVALENDTELDIESLAKQVTGELLEAMPALRAADRIERGTAIARALSAERGSTARLKTAINDDSSFGDLRGGWVEGGTVGRRLNDDLVPHLLINCVIDGHSINSFIKEARAFANCPTSIIESYTPLTGAKLAETVSLGVRRHMKSNIWQAELMEYLAHLVGHFKRRIYGIASAGFRLSFV